MSRWFALKSHLNVWFWTSSALLTVVLWWIPRKAPLHEKWGDLWRGWPFAYGLDQGDVVGDGYAFATAHFHPLPFLLDAVVGFWCGLAFSIIISWMVAVFSRGKVTDNEPEHPDLG